MIDTRLARETARLGHSATLRQQVYGLCDELDETREKLNDVKQAYAALDQNWCNIHNAMGDAVRRALGLPDATVPEIVAAIDSLRANLKVAEEELERSRKTAEFLYEQWNRDKESHGSFGMTLRDWKDYLDTTLARIRGTP